MSDRPLSREDAKTARELLYDAREAFELDPLTGGPDEEDIFHRWMQHPRDFLTWDLLESVAEGPVDRCFDCEETRPFEPNSEDRCDECGQHGTMSTGFMVTLWGVTNFVAYR